MSKIAVIGSGSWGLALAKHLIENNNDVKIWSYSEEEVYNLNNNQSSIFLPDIKFPENLKAYTDFKEVVSDAKYILHVTPSVYTREIVKKYKEYTNKDQIIILCSKGFEKKSKTTLEQVIQEELPENELMVLTGPSHAEEVSFKIPTGLLLASENDEKLDDVINLFDKELIRIYKSNDVIGAGIGGAVKNILAFAAGIVAGLELGDNTFAAMITRGLVELARFTKEMGGNPQTIYGLSGLGDLVVTSMSNHSRNRRAGLLLAKGYSIEEIREEIGQTIESIDNIETVYHIAKNINVDVPITNTIYDILYNNKEVKEAVKELMLRDTKFEKYY